MTSAVLSIENIPESLSQGILVWIILVGRLGVLLSGELGLATIRPQRYSGLARAMRKSALGVRRRAPVGSEPARRRGHGAQTRTSLQARAGARVDRRVPVKKHPSG